MYRPEKLGSGKEMVDRLTNLISIFENPQLDFSKNKAERDDTLGDAYEFLMRHFATESGKSKGQFYTPCMSLMPFQYPSQRLGMPGYEVNEPMTLADI